MLKEGQALNNNIWYYSWFQTSTGIHSYPHGRRGDTVRIRSRLQPGLRESSKQHLYSLLRIHSTYKDNIKSKMPKGKETLLSNLMQDNHQSWWLGLSVASTLPNVEVATAKS